MTGSFAIMRRSGSWNGPRVCLWRTETYPDHLGASEGKASLIAELRGLLRAEAFGGASPGLGGLFLAVLRPGGSFEALE
jgi:hypothetical protein